jgi:hypothetical protein
VWVDVCASNLRCITLRRFSVSHTSAHAPQAGLQLQGLTYLLPNFDGFLFFLLEFCRAFAKMVGARRRAPLVAMVRGVSESFSKAITRNPQPIDIARFHLTVARDVLCCCKRRVVLLIDACPYDTVTQGQVAARSIHQGAGGACGDGA